MPPCALVGCTVGDVIDLGRFCRRVHVLGTCLALGRICTAVVAAWQLDYARLYACSGNAVLVNPAHMGLTVGCAGILYCW